MRDARVAPTLVSFNALASAHAACGDLANVEAVLAMATAQPGLRLDRYSYGALLQACTHKGGHKGRGGPERAKAAKAKAHVEGLLASNVPMNDFLETMCKRAVGDDTFEQMVARARQQRRRSSPRRQAAPAPAPAGPPGLGAWGRGAPAAAPAPMQQSWPTAIQEEAEAAAVEEAADAAAAVAAEADGWATVSKGGRKAWRGGGRPGAGARAGSHRATAAAAATAPTPSGRAAAQDNWRRSGANDGGASRPTSAIKKPKAPSTPKASTGADPNGFSGVKIVGIPMTRSKSARARLLYLAQEIVGDSSDNLDALNTKMGPLGPLPLKRSTRSELAGLSEMAIPQPISMRRSAHSELAITMSQSMAL
jgi:hypothetical protein